MSKNKKGGKEEKIENVETPICVRCDEFVSNGFKNTN